MVAAQCYRRQWVAPVLRSNSVREPRAFSLERATMRRKRERRLGHYTPPRTELSTTSKTSERPPCLPFKQNRSYSTDFNAGHHHPMSNCAFKKTPIRRLDEEAIKRSRNHNSQYELSQDLLDKQVEMLERKYGGIRARHAALTIQRAFRKYCMMKRFRDIASASKGDRRLSRRFFTTECLESKDWTMYSSQQQQHYSLELKQHHDHISQAYIDYALKANFSNLYTELGESQESNSSTKTASSKEEIIEIKLPPHQGTKEIRSDFIKTSAVREVSKCDHHYSPKLRGKQPPAGWSAPPVQAPPLQTPSSPSSHPILRESVNVIPDEPLKECLGRPKSRAKVPLRSTTVGWNESNQDNCSSSLPVWKSLDHQSQVPLHLQLDEKRHSNISEDSLEGAGFTVATPDYGDRTPLSNYKVSEVLRKRQYRVGLNLFNKKPERGILYLIQRAFLESSPQAVARFLVSRKGLSKHIIGEYLGNLQSSFNMAVLEFFVQELDLAGMQVDVALRKFQTYFRMPGEAQKIERLVEVFSHRYVECNRDIVSKFQSADTVFVLAFAIIMLHTDLHTPNMKADKRMKLEDFIKNLRGVDDSHDLDRDMLAGIYERIKINEFKPGSDHVTQVLKVQLTIVGKKPNLALPHRRLVCYCRLYEVYDVNKKERPGLHQREVFLFNDMLMVTKIFSKKKNSVSYTFRQSFPLNGLCVSLFEAPHYPQGIRLSQRVDDKVLVTFNARNQHDRSKFVEDLKESILEMDEMENLRIEGELEKQKMVRARSSENRDSGVADMEIVNSTSNKENTNDTLSTTDCNLKRSALSNSLLELHENQKPPLRRGSAGSLDSGMSISFQSSAASTVSHESSPPEPKQLSNQHSFLGGLFGKKGSGKGKPPV